MRYAVCRFRGLSHYLSRLPNCRTSVRPSVWCSHDHTRHHLSPRGLNQRPVHVGVSAQCVACSCLLYTIAQHFPASDTNPGWRSPGWGSRGNTLVTTADRTDGVFRPSMRVNPRISAR